MTRRSPLNKRYQNDQRSNEPTGSTRKSAASAKIQRATSSSKDAKPRTFRERLAASKGAGKTNTVILDTPELKRWRRIWWIVIFSALGALVPSFILNTTKMAQDPPWNWISVILMLISALLVIATWVLDFAKIRPLTKQAQREAQSGKKK